MTFDEILPQVIAMARYRAMAADSSERAGSG